jgi:hypothetical protein
MVIATTISIQGTLGEVTLPPRTPDVLEWLRKKYKQPDLQFQGKLTSEDCSYTVFASPTEDDDESTNQHMLPAPFHEDTFQGTIVILKSSSTHGDEYEKPATAYTDLRSSEYDDYYSSCSFDEAEEEEIQERGQRPIPKKKQKLIFIDNICNVSTEIFSKFKAPPHVCGIAYHIFHLFQKKVPFSEFNHLMLASLSVFVACKIHNIHVLYENFQKFYYENKGKLKSLSKPS